jgi:hypothetical protein
MVDCKTSPDARKDLSYRVPLFSIPGALSYPQLPVSIKWLWIPGTIIRATHRIARAQMGVVINSHIMCAVRKVPLSP